MISIAKEFIEATWKNFNILSIYFYFCFVPFTFIYYTVAKKFHFQWLWLLAASLFFYLANCPLKLFACILVPICITYFASQIVLKFENKQKSYFMFFVIALNIGFLIWFKERNFFITNWNLLASVFKAKHLQHVNIIAPFGISYIILMLTSYFIDVSWQTAESEKNPLKFLLYALFFPVTTSGPIARYVQVKESLFCEHSFNYRKFCFGIQRVAWGFFKKLVIADRIALIVQNVYSTDSYTGFITLVGLLSYAFQLYFDFSGCMEIVLGIGEILGVKLPENFRQPFFSTSLSEIWRRWHITLGLFLKDYVLYTILRTRMIKNLTNFLKTKLGKKNRFTKLIPTWCGMFVVWFLVGFWHGGSWNWICGSGLFYFLLISLGQLLEPFFIKIIQILKINTQTKSWIWFQRFRTVFIFCVCNSIDRAVSLKKGLAMWQNVFAEWNPWIFVDGTLFRLGLNAKDFFVVVFAIIVWMLVETYENKGDKTTDKGKLSARDAVARQNLVFRWSVYIGLVLSIFVFGIYGPGFDAKSFIYGAM